MFLDLDKAGEQNPPPPPPCCLVLTFLWGGGGRGRGEEGGGSRREKGLHVFSEKVLGSTNRVDTAKKTVNNIYSVPYIV